MKNKTAVSPATPKLNKVQEQLMVALRIMRDACNDAEREILREKSPYSVTEDMPRIMSIIHALNWGMANASSHIGNALSRFEFNLAWKEFKAIQ